MFIQNSLCCGKISKFPVFSLTGNFFWPFSLFSLPRGYPGQCKSPPSPRGPGSRQVLQVDGGPRELHHVVGVDGRVLEQVGGQVGAEDGLRGAVKAGVVTVQVGVRGVVLPERNTREISVTSLTLTFFL